VNPAVAAAIVELRNALNAAQPLDSAAEPNADVTETGEGEAGSVSSLSGDTPSHGSDRRSPAQSASNLASSEGLRNRGAAAASAASGYERRRAARRVLRALEGLEVALSSSIVVDAGAQSSYDGDDGDCAEHETIRKEANLLAQELTDDLVCIISELPEALVGIEGVIPPVGPGGAGIDDLVNRSVLLGCRLLRGHRSLPLDDDHAEALLERVATVTVKCLSELSGKCGMEATLMQPFPRLLGPTLAVLNGALRRTEDLRATSQQSSSGGIGNILANCNSGNNANENMGCLNIDPLVFPSLEARETIHLLDALLRRALRELSIPWKWFDDQNGEYGDNDFDGNGMRPDNGGLAGEVNQRECSAQLRELIGFLLRQLSAILSAKKAGNENMDSGDCGGIGKEKRMAEDDSSPLYVLLEDSNEKNKTGTSDVGLLTRDQLEDISDLLHEFVAESVEYALDAVDGASLALRTRIASACDAISRDSGSSSGPDAATEEEVAAAVERQLLIREALRHVSLAVGSSEALMRGGKRGSVLACPPPGSIRALCGTFASFVASECHSALSVPAGARRDEDGEEGNNECLDVHHNASALATELSGDAVRAAADDLLVRLIALANHSHRDPKDIETHGKGDTWGDRDVRSVALLRAMDLRSLSAKEVGMLVGRVDGFGGGGEGDATAAVQASVLASLLLPTGAMSDLVSASSHEGVPDAERYDFATRMRAEQIDALVGGLLLSGNGESKGCIRQQESPWHSIVARKVSESMGCGTGEGGGAAPSTNTSLTHYADLISQRVDTLAPWK